MSAAMFAWCGIPLRCSCGASLEVRTSLASRNGLLDMLMGLGVGTCEACAGEVARLRNGLLEEKVVERLLDEGWPYP
ncbi:hypothetical protein Tdes44962_MAKER07525 [Teratosphaeria destructans]|uniref:Uncharacterized protein n=1 Tax=Teratosphaeria destructans TaxID=418781 RepID=A0A9W7SZ30_9PEZI|nr:hypothetical protein Tdes44962_MAKER07525 [Teratosphaeria destructans]